MRIARHHTHATLAAPHGYASNHGVLDATRITRVSLQFPRDNHCHLARLFIAGPTIARDSSEPFSRRRVVPLELTARNYLPQSPALLISSVTPTFGGGAPVPFKFYKSPKLSGHLLTPAQSVNRFSNADQRRFQVLDAACGRTAKAQGVNSLAEHRTVFTFTSICRDCYAAAR